MHPSVEQYLAFLHEKRKSPLTMKATRQDVSRFIAWWETRRHRSYEPALLRESDLLDWRNYRQKEQGAAPATINRGLASLRGYCQWATKTELMTDNVALEVKDVPTPPASPRGISKEAIDALLRCARLEQDIVQRLRNEAFLTLLIFVGLRVQEACDIQLRDVDLAAGTITIRSGKAGNARRLPLHSDVQRTIARYLNKVRCPDGLPKIGSQEECESLLVRVDVTEIGQPWKAGMSQRVAQRVVHDLGQLAAAQLYKEAEQESNIEQAGRLRKRAQQLEQVTPHQLRHSLAQRMLDNGAKLNEVQRMLGHTRLSTTGIYLTPSEDDLREAMDNASL